MSAGVGAGRRDGRRDGGREWRSGGVHYKGQMMSGRAAVCGPSIKHYDFNYHPRLSQPHRSPLIRCIGLGAGRIKGAEKNIARAREKKNKIKCINCRIFNQVQVR